MEKTKIGILGVGAIGSVIACHLFDNQKIELLYFNRSAKTEIRLQTSDHFFDLKIKTQQTISQKIDLDWLIICLKEYHFQKARIWFKNLISTNTKIAVIRNGIELKKPLLPYSLESQILECMIDCPTQLDSDGNIIQLRNPIITSISGGLTMKFQVLFSNKNIKFRTVIDFKTENWKKLIESASLGAITCLTGETCWIFKDKKIKDLYQELVTEGIKVAKADGAIIPIDFVNTLLEKLNQYPKEKGTSMLTDRKRGRPIELGAKNGAIVNVGKKYKIGTPLNELTVTILSQTNVKNF